MNIKLSTGADSAILDNLSRAVDDKTKLRIFRTQQHLNIYSKKGLRVLCMAKRVLTEPEYEDWAMKHKEAENALSNRERKLQDSYLRIEKNLSLIGRFCNCIHFHGAPELRCVLGYYFVCRT